MLSCSFYFFFSSSYRGTAAVAAGARRAAARRDLRHCEGRYRQRFTGRSVAFRFHRPGCVWRQDSTGEGRSFLKLLCPCMEFYQHQWLLLAGAALCYNCSDSLRANPAARVSCCQQESPILLSFTEIFHWCERVGSYSHYSPSVHTADRAPTFRF